MRAYMIGKLKNDNAQFEKRYGFGYISSTTGKLSIEFIEVHSEGHTVLGRGIGSGDCWRRVVPADLATSWTFSLGLSAMNVAAVLGVFVCGAKRSKFASPVELGIWTSD